MIAADARESRYAMLLMPFRLFSRHISPLITPAFDSCRHYFDYCH